MDVYAGWNSDMPEVLGRECPVCRGWGIVSLGKTERVCPECGGTGIVGGVREMYVPRAQRQHCHEGRSERETWLF